MPKPSPDRDAQGRGSPGAALVVGGALLGAGVVVLVVGRLVGPDSRAPLYWGLLLCTLSLPPFRSALVQWRWLQAVTLGDEVPDRHAGPSPAGILLTLAPAILTVGFLLTDPAPVLESIYLPVAVVFDWLAATILWAGWKARQRQAQQVPAAVRFVWPMVPGFALLGYALTAPGSKAWGCDDGATCFDGPIALSIPALIVLVFGVIAGVVGARGSALDKQARLRFKALDPISRGPGRQS